MSVPTPANTQIELDPSTEKDNTVDCIEKLRRFLPVIDAISHTMDRVSIVRLTKAYLGVRNIPNKPWPAEQPDPDLRRSHMLQAMDMLIFVTGEKGRILFATENVSTVLGVSQYQILGTDFYEMISGSNGRELAELIDNSLLEETCHKVSLMIKSKQGKRPTGYVTTVGHKHYKHAECQIFTQRGPQGVSVMICGTVLDRNGYPEMTLNRSQVVVYTGLDLKIVFVPSGSPSIMGTAWNELYGTSLYQLIHPDDVIDVMTTHAQTKQHINYEKEICALRLIKKDLSYAYAILYFIYKKENSGRNSDTIKIIITHYGDVDPRAGASSPDHLNRSGIGPDVPSVFHPVQSEPIPIPLQAVPERVNTPFPQLLQDMPVMDVFIPPPTLFSFDFSPFLGIDPDFNG